jgi:TolA-binding protein
VDVRYLGQVHQVMAGGQWRSPAVKVSTEALLDGANQAAVIDAGAGEAPAGSEAAPIRPVPSADPSPVSPSAPSPSASSTPAEISTLSAEYAAAARLESAAPRQALHRYLELSRRNDRWGRNALFAAARLALDIGDRDRAAQLARSYLRRFPDGPNAPDARVLLEARP